MARQSERATGRRPPASPDLPKILETGSAGDASLQDEGIYLASMFTGHDLSGQQATGAEIEQCRYDTVNLSRVTLRRSLVRDTVFERCDLANLSIHESSARRVSAMASRMTGLRCLDTRLHDVTITDCVLDLASWRFCRFADVVFSGCRLRQADFGGADLSGVRFEYCDLSGAQFSGAVLTGARLTGCDLTAISGVGSLRGAIVTTADAVALAVTLAAALGITIEDEG